MNRSFMSALALAGTLFLTGCSVPAAEETARCHFDNATPQERFERVALNQDFSRDACIEQGLFDSLMASLGSDPDYRAQVVDAYRDLAEDDRDHQAGAYARMVLAVNSVTPEGARNAGELGLFMESVARTRKAALSCGMLAGSDLGVVAQVDSLFVLASLGHYVGMADPVLAKAVMAALIEGAALTAEGQPTPPCDEQLGRDLEQHLTAWRQFYEGQHPWTGTCRPEITDTELRLSCPAA